MAGLPKMNMSQTKWQDIEKPENMKEAKKVAEENKEAIDKKEKAFIPEKKESKLAKALNNADKTLASSGIGSKGAEATMAGVGEKGAEAVARNEAPAPEATSKSTSEPEVSEDLQNKLLDTDEGQVAQEAIETKSLAPLEKITDPETGEPFVLPTYDKDGRVTALKPLVPENNELYNQKTAIMLTLLSIAISGITGGMFPPINFIDIRWDEVKNKAAELENEVIRMYNNEIDLANKSLVETRKTQQEAQVAQDNPELYSRENTDAVARANAAVAGNVALEQTQMNADLQKALQEKGFNFDVAKMKLSNEQQITLSKLLYDQEVSKVFDQIKKMKDEGYSNDVIAKFISSMAGTTTLARGLGYAKDVTGMATDIVNSILPLGISDKTVKTFDAPEYNTSMLRKSFKWR